MSFAECVPCCTEASWTVLQQITISYNLNILQVVLKWKVDIENCYLNFFLHSWFCQGPVFGHISNNFSQLSWIASAHPMSIAQMWMPCASHTMCTAQPKITQISSFTTKAGLVCCRGITDSLNKLMEGVLFVPNLPIHAVLNLTYLAAVLAVQLFRGYYCLLADCIQCTICKVVHGIHIEQWVLLKCGCPVPLIQCVQPSQRSLRSALLQPKQAWSAAGASLIH